MKINTAAVAFFALILFVVAFFGPIILIILSDIMDYYWLNKTRPVRIAVDSANNLYCSYASYASEDFLIIKVMDGQTGKTKTWQIFKGEDDQRIYLRDLTVDENDRVWVAAIHHRKDLTSELAVYTRASTKMGWSGWYGRKAVEIYEALPLVQNKKIAEKNLTAVAQYGSLLYGIEDKKVAVFGKSNSKFLGYRGSDHKFVSPRDIAVDEYSRIYVVDAGGLFGHKKGIYTARPSDPYWRKIVVF